MRIVEDLSQNGLDIQFSTPEDYLNAVDWYAVPTHGGEFNSAFQGTFTTNIFIKQEVRRLVGLIRVLETLSVAAGNRPIEYPALWEMVLKQQFHDIICGSICDAALAECRSELMLAEEAVRKAIADLEDPESPPAFFNQLCFPRNETVEYRGVAYRVDLEPFTATPINRARKIELSECPELPVTFESDYYAAKVGKDGYVYSLRLSDNDKDLVDSVAAPFGALALQMDYGDAWLNFDSPLSGGSIESSLTQNHPDPLIRHDVVSLSDRRTFFPIVDHAAIIAFGNGHMVITQTGTLSFWRIEIPFVTTVVFPTSVNKGKIRQETPFGYVEREPREHVAQSWMDYSDNVDCGTLLLTLFRAIDMDYKRGTRLLTPAFPSRRARGRNGTC